MIRVCFLLGGFQGNGGIGRATSIVANNLAQEDNIEVHTISYSETSKERRYDVSSSIHEYLLFKKCVSMTKAMLFEHAISKVHEIVKENKIDFLIACGALYYPLGILSVRGTKAKCICVEHTSPDTTADHKFQMLCRKIAVRKADKVVTITDAAKKYYIDVLGARPEKVCRIYNPVPSEYYQSNAYNADSKKIISVGRLCYPKNFLRLVDIAKVVLDQKPEWNWDIYGEGDERVALQEKINQCGLTERLILRGQVPDLLQRYQEYAFIVMTSRYEGFPMSLLEASANRLPMVSFDIKTGPNEIIVDGKNGYLLHHDDTDGMTEKLLSLMQNCERRIAMSNSAIVTADQFGIKQIIEQWRSLFCELL